MLNKLKSLLYARNSNRTIAGTVSFNETGQPIPGAQIKVFDSDRLVLTDPSGRYSIPVDGDCRITLSYLSLEGNQTLTTPPIQLEKKGTHVLNFQL